ncbi:MAG: HAD hydrolase-like protein [Rhizobiales bacterium]|nr:HAD hydrolase-like protein [Hyphomicrobiales bacterium]
MSAVTKHRGTLVFDLDGTLVDSAPDLADSLDLLLAEQGKRPLGLDIGRSLIGHGISNLVAKGLDRSGLKLDGPELEERIKRFHEIYADNLSRKTRPYAGVKEGLSLFQSQGFRLAVCTNKLEKYSRQILVALELAAHFDQVAGPDTFGVAKPDPRHLLLTIESLEGKGKPAVMIGESEVDIALAKAAGIPVIAVSYGYAKVPLAPLQPDALVPSFDALPTEVHRLL